MLIGLCYSLPLNRACNIMLPLLMLEYKMKTVKYPMVLQIRLVSVFTPLSHDPKEAYILRQRLGSKKNFGVL